MPPKPPNSVSSLTTRFVPRLRRCPSKRPFSQTTKPQLSPTTSSRSSAFAEYLVNLRLKAVSNSASPESSAWGSSQNPAAFDFRSDVVTTPTASMLDAITNCTLLDDVFQEDTTTTNLESFIAELTGHEDALLVLSGTMGNQVALRAHLTAPPHAVLCDKRSHIVQYEAGGVASLSQAMLQTISPKNGKYITLEEVEENAVISDNVHYCPTRVISLENTLDGILMPLSEVRAISKFARKNDIIMHMDGARLWNAVVAGGGTLKEYCAELDSVSLCFSKGLGAPIGSIITGTKSFIKRARWIRKSIGGGLRQAGVVAASARVAVEETFLGGKLEQSHINAQRIQKIWTDLGGKVEFPVDTNMVWLDLKAHKIPFDQFMELGETYGLRFIGGRLVVHYQISEEAIERFTQLSKEILKGEEGSFRSTKTKADELKDDLASQGQR